MSVSYTVDIEGITFGFNWLNQTIETDNLADEVTADQLKDAIKNAEATVLGIVFTTIAEFGNPVTLVPNVATALNVILQDNWKILTLRTSGTFSITGGNVVNELTGAGIFEDNPSVTTINNLSQAGVRINVGGSALTSEEAIRLNNIEKFLRNRQYTNPLTGKIEQYSDDDQTIEFEADIFADDGVTPYDGTNNITRRNRYESP